MEVIKRNGSRERVKLDKILNRVKKQCYGLNMDYVEPMEIAKKVIHGLYDGITSVELDVLAAETAAALTPTHPDYSILAARISITSLHKVTPKSFSQVIDQLYNYIDTKTGMKAPLIADDVYEIVMQNVKDIDSQIIYDRDLDYDYFGFKTLEKSYLLKIDGHPAERPQQMLMRVAIGIHKEDLASAYKTYDLMSQGFFTHATPTLFNSGTRRPQLSSCFLISMQDDSIQGIYKTLADVAQISKNAGGIGLHIHNVRGTGSYIRGTNGTSNGIIPMLKVFNETARYVDQCFTGDTKVLTNRGSIEISDVNTDDSVLTSDGNFNKVLYTKPFNYTGDLIKITTPKGTVNVTPDHLFLCVTGINENDTNDIIKSKLKLGIIPIEWIEAKNIDQNSNRIVSY
jgi:ribonucleoside-diphosphate reductase alpha chain